MQQEATQKKIKAAMFAPTVSASVNPATAATAATAVQQEATQKKIKAAMLKLKEIKQINRLKNQTILSIIDAPTVSASVNPATAATAATAVGTVGTVAGTVNLADGQLNDIPNGGTFTYDNGDSYTGDSVTMGGLVDTFGVDTQFNVIIPSEYENVWDMAEKAAVFEQDVNGVTILKPPSGLVDRDSDDHEIRFPSEAVDLDVLKFEYDNADSKDDNAASLKALKALKALKVLLPLLRVAATAKRVKDRVYKLQHKKHKTTVICMVPAPRQLDEKTCRWTVDGLPIKQPQDGVTFFERHLEIDFGIVSTKTEFAFMRSMAGQFMSEKLMAENPAFYGSVGLKGCTPEVLFYDKGGLKHDLSHGKAPVLHNRVFVMGDDTVSTNNVFGIFPQGVPDYVKDPLKLIKALSIDKYCPNRQAPEKCNIERGFRTQCSIACQGLASTLCLAVCGTYLEGWRVWRAQEDNQAHDTVPVCSHIGLPLTLAAAIVYYYPPSCPDSCPISSTPNHALWVLGLAFACQYFCLKRHIPDKMQTLNCLVVFIALTPCVALPCVFVNAPDVNDYNHVMVILAMALLCMMSGLECLEGMAVVPTHYKVTGEKYGNLTKMLVYRLIDEKTSKERLTHIEERWTDDEGTSNSVGHIYNVDYDKNLPALTTTATGCGCRQLRNGWLCPCVDGSPKGLTSSAWRCCTPHPTQRLGLHPQSASATVVDVCTARAEAVQTTMSVVNEVYRLALPSVRMSGKAVERTLLGLLKVNPETAPLPESMGCCQPVCDSMSVWMPVALAAVAYHMLRTQAFDLMYVPEKFNTNFATCAADDPTAQLKRATARGTMTSIVSAIYTNMLNAGYDVDGNINAATSTAMIGLLLNSTIGYLADTGFATNDGLRAFYQEGAEWCSKDLTSESAPDITTSLLNPSAFRNGWTRMIGTLGSGQFVRFFITNMLDVFINLTIFTQGFVLFQNYVPFFQENPVWANTMLSGFLSTGTYYAYSAFVRVMYAYWSPHAPNRDGAMHFASVFALTALAGVVFLLADTQDYSDPQKMGIMDQMVNHPLIKFFMLWCTLGLMGFLAMNSMSQTELSAEKVFGGVFCLRDKDGSSITKVAEANCSGCPAGTEAMLDAHGQMVCCDNAVIDPQTNQRKCGGDVRWNVPPDGKKYAVKVYNVVDNTFKVVGTDLDQVGTFTVEAETTSDIMSAVVLVSAAEPTDGKLPNTSKLTFYLNDANTVEDTSFKNATRNPTPPDGHVLVARQRTVHLPGETQDVRMGAALACLLVWGTTWITFATSRKLHRCCEESCCEHPLHCVSGIGCPLAQSLLLTVMFVGPLSHNAVHWWMRCFALEAPIGCVATLSIISFLLSCISTTCTGPAYPLDDERASFA